MKGGLRTRANKYVFVVLIIMMLREPFSMLLAVALLPSSLVPALACAKSDMLHFFICIKQIKSVLKNLVLSDDKRALSEAKILTALSSGNQRMVMQVYLL